MFKDVYREVGMLEVFVTCLHRFAALLKDPQADGGRVKILVVIPYFINSFLASGDFHHHLLINFANSLYPDQDQHNVGADLDPNHLKLIVLFCISVHEDFFYLSIIY